MVERSASEAGLDCGRGRSAVWSELSCDEFCEERIRVQALKKGGRQSGHERKSGLHLFSYESGSIRNFIRTV